MMRLNKQSLNHQLKKLEIIVTVIWLIYFIGIDVPSPIPQLMKVLSYGIIAILVGLHWKRLSWVAIRDIFCLLMIGTILASVIWSANIGTTIDASRGLLRTFLFGAYLATRYSLKEQIKILTWVFGIVAVLSLVVPFVIPSYWSSDGWRGICPHKNVFGSTMTIGAIFFLISVLEDFKEHKFKWWIGGGFFLSVVLIVLSQSSNALINLVFLLSLMPIYKIIRQHYKLKIIIIVLFSILAGSIVVLIIGNLDTILVDLIGKDTTFNGRIPVWNLIIDKVGERPLLGYGYNAFWSSDAGLDVILNSWAANNRSLRLDEVSFNAHSAYFEILAELGFIGISLYVISLVTVFIRVFILLALSKQIEYFYCFQFLMFTSVASFAAIYFPTFSANSTFSCIYISICLSTAIEWRRIKVRKKQGLLNA